MTTSAQKIVRHRYKSQRALRPTAGIYSRGVNSVSLTVIAGRTPTELIDSEAGLQIRSMVRDILILPDELVINDVEIKPIPGDIWTEEDGTLYEVIRLGSEPAWRWSEQTKQILRVHTQQIAGT